MATKAQIEAARKALADGHGIGAAIDAANKLNPQIALAEELEKVILELVDDDLNSEEKRDFLHDAIDSEGRFFQILKEYADNEII